MLKLFALTMLFSLTFFLAMAAAMLRHSRRGKCNCKISAQIMSRAAAAGRPGTACGKKPLAILSPGCAGCENQAIACSQKY